MPIRIDLGRRFSDCPIHWRSFIRKLEEEIPEQQHRRGGGFSTKTINKQLTMYHATFFQKGQRYLVDFSDEARYNLFVLKYG